MPKAVMSRRPPPQHCVHCGRVCGDLKGGSAKVPEGKSSMVQLCHPNEQGRPDCYRNVTVHHHQLRDCPRCIPEPWVPLDDDELRESMLASFQRLNEAAMGAIAAVQQLAPKLKEVNDDATST